MGCITYPSQKEMDRVNEERDRAKERLDRAKKEEDQANAQLDRVRKEKVQAIAKLNQANEKLARANEEIDQAQRAWDRFQGNNLPNSPVAFPGNLPTSRVAFLNDVEATEEHVQEAGEIISYDYAIAGDRA